MFEATTIAYAVQAWAVRYVINALRMPAPSLLSLWPLNAIPVLRPEVTGFILEKIPPALALIVEDFLIGCKNEFVREIVPQLTDCISEGGAICSIRAYSLLPTEEWTRRVITSLDASPNVQVLALKEACANVLECAQMVGTVSSLLPESPKNEWCGMDEKRQEEINSQVQAISEQLTESLNYYLPKTLQLIQEQMSSIENFSRVKLVVGACSKASAVIYLTKKATDFAYTYSNSKDIYEAGDKFLKSFGVIEENGFVTPVIQKGVMSFVGNHISDNGALQVAIVEATNLVFAIPEFLAAVSYDIVNAAVTLSGVDATVQAHDDL